MSSTTSLADDQFQDGHPSATASIEHQAYAMSFEDKLEAAAALVRYGRRESPVLVWEDGELCEMVLPGDPGELDEIEEDEGEWEIKLPIYGTIAQRRAVTWGIDVIDLKRKQWAQLQHEVLSREGELKDVDTSFVEIDWAPKADEVVMKRLKRGEPVSPGQRPTVEQMTQEEWEAEAYT